MILDKIIGLFNSQLIKFSAKLPVISKTEHIIQDNNQSINNGVINEKLDVNVRSTIKSNRKRVAK